nr:uncharacterized protein LOC106680855 [Halyomorpha halys]
MKSYSYLVNKLFIAVVEGDLQSMKDLVSLGANINHINLEHGDTLMHYAPTEEVANYLILNMARANVSDKYGQTPLCCAAAKPNGLEVVNVLLAAGADVNVKMLNGTTPLHYAPTLEMTQVLLQHGAQVNVTDKYGRTPLHAALIEKKGLEVFKCLLAAGADINATMGSQKHTVLHYADSLHIVREILSRGFDVNVTTTKNQTPLHLAVKHMKEYAVIHELLKCGANVNIKDSNGDIPIFYAIRNYKKDFAVVQLLVEYGSSQDQLFKDHEMNRRANCMGYTVSRNCIALCKLIGRVALLLRNGIVDDMPVIGNDACPKAKRDNILNYVDQVAEEIPLLKKYKIFGDYSLYDLLVNKKILMKPVYTSFRKLEHELSAKFPFYHEMILMKIRPYLERGRLLSKLRWLQISFTNANKDVVTLNPDCTCFIIQMLPDDSLWNLLIALEI